MKKSDLLGQVTKMPKKENCVPDIDAMKDFEWEEGVCHSFCTFCGIQLEINKSLASELAEMADISFHEDLRNYYFELHRCFMCSDDFDGVTFRLIGGTESSE